MRAGWLLLLVAALAFSSAEVITWAGASKIIAAWETDSNWDLGRVPLPSDDVRITFEPCYVQISTATTISSLTVGYNCGVFVTAPLTVTGIASTHSIEASRIELQSTITVSSGSLVDSFYVFYGVHSGTLVIGKQLAFVPLSGCDSGSLVIEGDLLMSNYTLRTLFGSSVTQNYSTIDVQGTLIMNDMLYEMIVSDADGWAALNTVFNPVTAKAITGTYSSHSLTGCTCGAPGPPTCGDQYLAARGCSNTDSTSPAKRQQSSHVSAVAKDQSQLKRGGSIDCSTYTVLTVSQRGPEDGIACTTSDFGVLLGSSSCTTSGSTPPPTCPPYLTGSGCSTPICAPYTSAANNCNLHGTCTLAGTGSACFCATGWTGTDCSIPICTTPCSRNGNCTAPDTCTCTSALWTGPTCSTPVCSPTCGTNGICDGRLNPPVCVCNTGFTNAPACDQAATTCPGTPLCSSHGTCDSATLLCSCSGEWTGTACDLPMCNGASANLCGGHGSCNVSTTPHSCACDVGWTGANCDVPSCPKDCSGQGTCSTASGIPTCLCFSGWQEPDCANAVVIPTTTPDPTTFSTPSPNKTSDSQQLLTRTAAPSPSTRKKGMSNRFKLGLSIGLAALVVLLLVAGVLIWKFHGRLISLFASDSSGGEGKRRLNTSHRHNSDL